MSDATQPGLSNAMPHPHSPDRDAQAGQSNRGLIARHQSQSLVYEPEMPLFGGGFTSAQGAGARRATFTLRDLLIQAFYNKRLIRNCFLACTALGLLAAAGAHTRYTADSLLLMLPGSDSATLQDVAVPGIPAAIDGLKAVQSEIQLLGSEDVVRSAVEQAGPANLFPSVGRRRLFGLLSPSDPAQQVAKAVRLFRKNLNVGNETGTNVIRVSYTSPDRDLAVKADAALVDAYLDRRQAVYSGNAGGVISNEIARTNEKLNAIEAQIQAVRTQYNVLDMPQDIALATNRLDGLMQRQNQVQERRATVHAELTAAQLRVGAMPAQVFDSREITNNAAGDDTRNTLLRLQQDRAHMAAQYSSNWPALREMDQKIAALQGQVAQNARGNFFTARSIRNPVLDQLQSRLTSLQVEDRALDQQYAALNTQYEQANHRLADLRQADTVLHDLQRSRDVTDTIYRQLLTRQAGVQYQNNAASGREASLRVVQPATAPLAGSSMALLYLSTGLVLGLMFGVAASVIATLLRQVYIMPSEAERDLDLPNLADFDVNASQFHGGDSPHGIGNLAALLQDVMVDGRPLAVLQVVAASDAEGKSVFVRALATELAQGHGLRTLILDLQGDAHNEMRRLGGSVQHHLSMLEAGLPVAATEVPQLWVSVDAEQSSLGNPRTVVARSRELIEGLRQHFEMVLIVGPNEVTSYAARRLAGLADANLMLVRSEQTRAPVAAQLRDVILSSGGNLLGFAYTWRRYHIPASIYRWL